MSIFQTLGLSLKCQMKPQGNPFNFIVSVKYNTRAGKLKIDVFSTFLNRGNKFNFIVSVEYNTRGNPFNFIVPYIKGQDRQTF